MVNKCILMSVHIEAEVYTLKQMNAFILAVEVKITKWPILP